MLVYLLEASSKWLDETESFGDGWQVMEERLTQILAAGGKRAPTYARGWRSVVVEMRVLLDGSRTRYLRHVP